MYIKSKLLHGEHCCPITIIATHLFIFINQAVAFKKIGNGSKVMKILEAFMTEFHNRNFGIDTK